MANYLDLLQDLFRKLSTEPANGTAYTVNSALAETIARLPQLMERGELTADDILACDKLVCTPPPGMSLDTRELLSELNLAAAQILENDAFTRHIATNRCRILLELARGMDPAEHGKALRRVSASALDIATRYYLEGEDPNLVGDLNLQAGNVYMRGFGPVEHEVDRGLRYFVTGFCLKSGHAPAGELEQLQDLMRRAASFLLDTAPLGGLAGSDLARVHQRLETAVSVFETVGPPQGVERARFELLQFCIANRLLDAAEPLLASLQENLDQSPPALRLALPLYHADWLSQQFRPVEALAIIDRQFALDKVPEDSQLYASTIRANCLLLNDELDAAYAAFETLYQLASAPQGSAPEPQAADIARQFLALSHLGYLDARRDHIEAAAQRFEQAAQTGKATVLGTDEQMRRADLWARGLYDSGNWPQALEKYQQALSLRDRIADNITEPHLRTAFAGSWAQLDARVIELALRTDDPALALQTAEQSKSRTLRQMAGRHSPFGGIAGQVGVGGFQDRDSLRLLHEYAELETDRGRLEAELADADTETQSALRPALRDCLSRMRGLQTLLEKKLERSAFHNPDPRGESLSLESMLALLPDNNAGVRWGIVSYHSSGEGTGVLLAAPGTPPSVCGQWLAAWPYERILEEIYLPWAKTQQAAFDGTGTVEAWHHALELLRTSMDEILWQPVADGIATLGLTHLLILPHRALHLIPFAALRHAGAGSDLLDNIEGIAVAPAASFLLATARQTRAAQHNGDAVFFATPDQHAPLMAQEAALVADLWRRANAGPIALEMGAGAHPQALFERCRNARLLHIACHGNWDQANPGASGLHLAPLPPGVPALFARQDGLVTIAALLTQVSLPACRLVVLSACESGLARRVAADEPVSLPMAFLLAGADQVVASLWQVADDATLLLMGEFYRRYVAAGDVAESLAGAQRWLRALTGTEAAALLARNRLALDDCDLAPMVLERAGAQLDICIDYLQSLGSGSRPYASPDYWGAFICYGMPAAA